VNNDVIFIEVFSKQSMSTHIYSYDLKNKNIKAEILYDGCNTPVTCCNGTLIYVHSDFQTPPELYSAENDTPVRLTHSSYQKYEKLFRNIDMTVCSSEFGVISKCYYSKGKDISREPVIVWLHGGPQICSLNSYVPFELWLCSLGYTVYVPSYRGTLGYGVNWALSAREENIGVADLNDIADVIKTILNSQTSYNCKIGIAGVSYGAYLALRCAAMVSGVSAVFGFGAICDWQIQQSLTEKRNYDYWLLGKWHFNRDVKNISPYFEISKINIPVFLTHGKNDTDVPFRQIEEYKLLADKKGKHNIMFHFYDNEGHGLPGYKAENFEHWHKLLIHFFNYYLKEWDSFEIPFSNQSYLGGYEFEDSFDPLDTE
jgi:prolyl oligopeptidase